MSEQIIKKNRFTFGLGTIGRDMVYSMVSMYLIFYLSDILQLNDTTILYTTNIMLAARIFDALNDPIMGTIVDNTKSRFGKFKPWIVFGSLLSGLITILLFTDIGLKGSKFIAMFAVLYVAWGIAFTTNDISFWSMLPSLSTSQKEREKIGAFARICANIGLFFVVSGIVPITNALGGILGSMRSAYMVFAIGIVVILLTFQAITVFGVKEVDTPVVTKEQKESTSLTGMFKAIFKNDQLCVTAVSMSLFMIGYMTTTSFGLYFFKYAYKDEGMYSIFALILGVAQLTALSVFPLFSKKFTRKQLYTGSIILVICGYIVFFFSPMNMIPIGIGGLCIFFGQAFIQLLMLMFLADTVEYGQWKLGKRNEGVTFSIQPFINKLGGAIASGIVGYIIVLSGINSASSPDAVTTEGLLLMKLAMLILPLISILAGFIVYLTKFKIDSAFFDRILSDLEKRSE
jgi:melibiose permease/lactose/raffinose/galactose permease